MPLSLHLAQPDVHTLSLRLATAGVELAGSLAAKDLALDLNSGEGEVRGSEVTIEGFEMRAGDLVARAASLSGTHMVIGWGNSGFRLQADSLSGPALSLSVGGLEFALGSYSLHDLALRGSDISVAQGSLSSVGVHARFESAPHPEPKQDAARAAAPDRPPLFDWHLFDGLKGDFNVDLEVDLTVPVIGSRRATHRFRVPIDAGTVDYRELEKDLSTLENALLDFAVRSDGTLVLERGIPFLPTRGRGKPILTWRLEPDDLELAHQDRIRLAVFPHFEVAGSDEPRDPDSPSSVALRSLSLENLEARLVLSAAPLPPSAAIRRLAVGELTLGGALHHQPGQEPRRGRVRGEMKGLGAEIVDLPLGAKRLSLGDVHLGSVSELEAHCAGLAPKAISCTLRDLAFEGLRVSEPTP